MTRHKERFHQAAKDNYLDLLREATRSECDAVDDNGMTPVMWAAFYGHLEALRVLMGRGADPDRADHMGSTALHFAALNGRMNCVTYLVNFGANIWTLDVDLHSALDLAALNEHRDIVDFLDDVAGRQAEVNKRTVAKMREKAVLEAQRRAKKRDKLMKKADRRAARESSDACDLHPSATNPNYRHAQGSASTSAVADGVSVVLERTNQTARPYSNIVAGSPSPSGAAATGGGAFFSSATSPNPKLQRSPMPEADIMYARSADGRSLASASAAASAAGAAAEPPRGVPGLFERPGFGNVAFLQPPQPQSPQSPNSLNPHPSHSPHSPQFPNSPNSPQLPQSLQLLFPPPASPNRTLGRESIGTSASLVLQPWRDMQWTEADVTTLAPDYDMDGLENFGDGDDIDGEPSTLETFLECLGLADYHHLLTREHLDLDGLALCSEPDLQSLGLPLGPRRRLLEGLARRRETLADSPQEMLDLRL
ncbi:hypothetical protein BOX15_Mlig022693g1 [Macrostomum lignano]|uniref:Uncharacterized protein n=2 Tax=Macrostomum lignano TaxID=282301 RepID=A0A267E9B8_9PLAT|nr:hypothetical protein BOX15_Mlig022693g1 [Macrostomum lignano]